jgi:hypothetical protein
VLLLTLTIQSCWLFKPRPRRPVVDLPPKDTVVVVTPDTTQTPTDTVPPPLPLFKDVYQVAVLLPFTIDSDYMNDFDFRDRTMPYRSMLSLELYQGMRLALDKLEAAGMRIRVYVYDTRNSPSEVTRILAQPELKSVDVIIGPLFEHSVLTVADFALRQRKYMISPLSHPELKGNNPYLICASPSFASHLTALANFVQTKYTTNRLLIVRTDDSSEAHSSRVFSERLAALGASSKPREIVGNSWQLFDRSMFGPDTTIVFCPSEDEVFVNEVTRQLSDLADNHPVILLGMPSWLSKLESIRYDYLDQLNFHMTSGLWVGKDSQLAEEVRDAYRQRYGIPPSDMVYRGYDLMYWLAQRMRLYGVGLADHFNEGAQPELFSRFYVLPANHEMRGSADVPVNYYENQFVNILRYKRFELVKVN